MRQAPIFFVLALSAVLTLGAAVPVGIADSAPASDGMIDHVMGGLNLTSDQRTRIARIASETGEKHMQLMSAIMEESISLKQALAMKNPDPTVVGKATIHKHELLQQLKQLQVDALKRIEAVLTKEQQEKFRRPVQGRMM